MAEHLEMLKKLLKDYYEACTAIKDEIAKKPEEERDWKLDSVAYELSYLKHELIKLVGKEMVRIELGVENLPPPSDELVSLIGQSGLTREEVESAIDEVWGNIVQIDERPMGPVEKKILHLVAEATPIKGDAEGNKFPFMIVTTGLSKNRRLYTSEALKDGAKLFDGAPIYLDHPDGVHDGKPQPRKFETKVGWWSDSRYVESSGSKPAGIIATANIFSNSAHSWLPGMMREAVESGKPDLIGVSIYVDIEAQPVRDDTYGVIYKVNRLANVRSADLVAEPAAGGRLVAAESIMEDLPKMDEKEKKGDAPPQPGITDDQFRDYLLRNKDHLKELVGETEKPAEKPADEKVVAFEAALEKMTQYSGVLEDKITKLAIAESRDSLRRALNEASLPAGVVEIAIGEAEGRKLTGEEIEGIVTRYKQVAIESSNDTIRRLPPQHREILVDYSGGGQVHPVDRVAAALDIFFGNEVAEGLKDTPKIVSFHQFYGQVTGDWNVTGYYDPAQSIIGPYLGMAAEALPTQAKFIGGGTLTFANLLGTSMNRRVLGAYRGQTRWWEPIAVEGTLTNFKQQDRIRLNHFGPLTNRPVGTEEYTELDWDETVESYAPSGWGNIVSVNRRAIINDDQNGIRRIPMLLARAANITLNEYVAALFTSNAGAGVTMTDTNTAFHATRSNITTNPLTYDNVRAARRAGMQITDDQGNRLMNLYRYLIVPVGLEDEAWVIANSVQVPGGANNDPSILSNRQRGIWDVLVAPNFDEAADWYMSVDPNESGMVPIEVGYINGQREPELFVQDGPTEGMVFAHDGVYYKVRFEFGADIIDAIGLQGNLP